MRRLILSTLGPLERSEMRNQIFWDRKTFKPIPAPPLFTVLRDMVLGCPKYIFGKFRSFLKTSENFFFFKNFLWSTFKRNFKIVLLQKILFSGAERPKIAHDPKNRFFKVRYINTAIQPRKKKHQNKVSSALKTF